MSADSVAQDQIKAFVDRILRLKEEARNINGDIREVYAEAKGNGFDKTALGKLVSYVEKRNTDSNAQAESEALFDLYLSAYDGAQPSHVHAYAYARDNETPAAWNRAAGRGEHAVPPLQDSSPVRSGHEEADGAGKAKPTGAPSAQFPEFIPNPLHRHGAARE